MTIAEVCAKYDISADTLRYYERVGVIPPIPRKKNGIRDYDEEACHWIELAICLRKAGVQIEALIEYTTLFIAGDDTITARKHLLMEQRDKQLIKLQEIQSSIDRLNYKIHLYETGQMTEEKIKERRKRK